MKIAAWWLDSEVEREYFPITTLNEQSERLNKCFFVFNPSSCHTTMTNDNVNFLVSYRLTISTRKEIEHNVNDIKNKWEAGKLSEEWVPSHEEVLSRETSG